MTAKDVIELEAARVRFYSANDESAFFEWLNKIQCIESYEGRGPAIYLLVKVGTVTESGLRELLSLFHRYKIAMSQLSVFDNEEFSAWFRDRRAYWYTSVFEQESVG